MLWSAVIVCGIAPRAAGTSITATASRKTCTLNEVLTVDVEVVNPTQASAPTPPRTSDFRIRLRSNRPNSSISIINGVTTASYTYVYEVRPLRQGRLTLPPFTLQDGGRVYRTRPVVIHVGKGAGPPELFCEVLVPRDTVYVGEAVALTLRVWVRKFTQRGIGTLDASTTFQLSDSDGSSFGVFEDAVAQTPRYDQARKRDAQGIAYEYYRFMWDTTVYPKATGPLDVGRVVIAWRYPTRLSRGVFGGLRFSRPPRRLQVSPTAPRVQVKAVPLEGRPGDFNGAIGRFTIETRAKPTRVPVGDPITLTMVIRGDVPLERLRAPKLSAVPDLVRDFEISGESLAGEVRKDRKVFSQTIRALRQDVAEIPPLPMSFFNPETGRYETHWSDAIAIEVLPARRLNLPVDAETPAGAPPPAALVESAAGLRANYADVDRMLADQSVGFGKGIVALLGGLPVLYLFTWIAVRRSARFRRDVALRRRARAYATAKRALRGGNSRTDPARVAGAVLRYVADRCNVPPAGLTRGDALRLLSEREVPDETRTALDAFLEALESARYAGTSRIEGDGMVSKARELIQELERCDLR